MDFKILGPLEVHADDGEPISVTRPLQRSALAALLLRAEQPCSRAWLIDALWGEHPPHGPDTALRSCIYGARRVLAAGHERLQTHPAGYLMHAIAGELDLATWRTLNVQGRAALDEHNAEGAARLLQQALDLWRDPPLVDLPGTPVIAGETARLLDQRRDAQDALMDARLALGHHRGVVAQLRENVTADPLREHVQAQLILALYRCGNRVEALAAYTRLRAVLAQEFGVDPSPELQELLSQILADDPALASRPAPVMAGSAAPPPWIPVCQLPAALPDFTGRSAEVQALVRGQGMAATVITGIPGIGKTSLALQAAHQVRSRFPDGQLFAGLGGCEHPRDPLDVLGEMLRALGVPPGGIPPSERERAALYRSLLAGRKVLVIADDAASAAQARALQPGTASSALIVTSRSRLAGLAGGHVLELGELPPADAVAMLGRITGRRRAEAEPGPAAAIAAACGHLPLAIRIAGSRLAEHPKMTLGTLAAALASEDSRIGQLAVGDQSVGARMAVSYRALDAPGRRAFRLLALHGPADIPAWLVPVVLGEPDAAGIPGQLMDAGLLSPSGDGATYRMHVLVRGYAASQLALDDLASAAAALGRIQACWLELADQADRHIDRPSHVPAPARLPCTVAPPAAGARSAAEAAAWFARERENLLAVTERACAEGRYGFAADLAIRQFAFQLQEKRYGDAAQLWQAIAAAAEKGGDALAGAHARYRLAVLAAAGGRWKPAHQILVGCLPAFLMARDVRALADALTLSAMSAEAGGDLAAALRYAVQGLDNAQQADEPRLMLQSLAALGTVLAQLGPGSIGVTCCEDAMTLAGGLDEPAYEALARRALDRADMTALPAPLAAAGHRDAQTARSQP